MTRTRYIRVVSEPEVRALVSPALALEAVREAFGRLGRGELTQPDPIGLEIDGGRGEVHLKGAYLHGSGHYSFKVASGFSANRELGLAVSSGMSLVFDAQTGALQVLILDNGYLTELRTGAAGALAADLLARRDVERVGVIGAGGQARFQLEALLGVRRPREVRVFSRRAEAAAAYATEMAVTASLTAIAVATARQAVLGADLVITATPSRTPIVEAGWLQAGVHVTAVGADMPGKRELALDVLARADRVVVDWLPQAALSGELHHALAAHVLGVADVTELGAIVAGFVPGRQRDDEITVADLTGVGALDAALANLVAVAAWSGRIGRRLRV